MDMTGKSDLSFGRNNNLHTLAPEVKMAVAAGSFYSDSPVELKRQINDLFSKTTNHGLAKGIRAIIVPHAGYIYSGIVAASVYKLLYGLKISRILVLGPSHYAGFNFAAMTAAKLWQTPFGQIPIDQDFNNTLLDNRHFKFLEDAYSKEHSIEVQLPFLQTIFQSRDFQIVPLLLGQETNYAKIGKRISELIDKHTLIVVSSDLSHYFSEAQANYLDKATIDLILAQNSKRIYEEADACGLEGIVVLNEIAKRHGWKPELVEYKTSGDMTGELASVVGYAGFIYR